MASYQYSAKWMDGENEAVEVAVAADVLHIGPDALAHQIRDTIARRYSPQLNLGDISVQIVGMLPS